MPTAHCPLPYEEEGSVLCRPGDDLLSHVLRQSTIGAKAFDGRVRDGIGSLSPCKGHQAGKERLSDDGGRRSDDRKGELVRHLTSVFRRPMRSKTGFSGDRDKRTDDGRGVIRPLSSVVRLLSALGARRALATRAIKSNERLVPVSFTRCRASTSGLSTWWSSTALQGELVLRLVSRLDAFSGYPFRI